MADLNSIKEKVNRMAKTAATMWQLTYDAFIEHDLELITKALEEEKKLNALEDEINQSISTWGARLPRKMKNYGLSFMLT